MSKIDGMEITKEQYERIQDCLPVQRGNVRHDNLVLLNAILYVAEQGCKWRGLPKRFGNWHSIYVRMNRWAKKGVLDLVFAKLQQEQIVRIKIEAFALDSTSVKVHPDGTGALKKRPPSHREISGWMEHQDSSGCRECSNGHNLLSVARPGPRCSCRPGTAARTGAAAGRSSAFDGSCVRRQ
jgi:transposase